MDFPHTQLHVVQQKLSFIATDPIDWKLYVQTISWAVALFEYLAQVLVSYSTFFCGLSFVRLADTINTLCTLKLNLRKLCGPFRDRCLETMEDKVKFALFSGLLKESIDSAMLHYGFYAWAWGAFKIELQYPWDLPNPREPLPVLMSRDKQRRLLVKSLALKFSGSSTNLLLLL